MTEPLTPCAKWTDDCQGKKDYDGRLLSISTRYWPGPEGGHRCLLFSGGQFSTVPYGPRPTAHTAIVLNHGAPDEYEYAESTVWREAEFEGDSEAETAAMVEAWVAQRFAEVRWLLGFFPAEGGQ